MPLNLPDKGICFVDADIFYCHFVETDLLSEPSTAFLEKVAMGNLEAYTSIHVLSEAIHKIMLAEAARRFARERAGLVNWLHRHPERIAELSEFRQAASELVEVGLNLLTTDATDLITAGQLSSEMGLLTNDAMIIALMRRYSLSHLVTNDDDFDGVPGITVWKPR